MKLKKILLKELNRDMVSVKYLKWINSKNLMQYTEQRFNKSSMKDILNFVEAKKKSKNEYLYGIFVVEENQNVHVGNIKLGPINFIHKYADISYFIGDLSYQKMGIGTSAIKKMLEISKKKFKLKKIFAGVYSNNISSQKVLIKNQFLLEGKLKNKYLYKNKRINEFLYGKCI